MKASELRIGNWVKISDNIYGEYHDVVYDSYSTKEFKIKGWNDNSHEKKGEHIAFYEIPSVIWGVICSGITTEYIEPIPLTEEWLVKFGFIEKNFGKTLPQSWYEVKYLSNEHEPMITSWVSILINKETWSCVICDEYPDEMGANTKTQIKYVHQLQNLYFALTGEELEIKE